MQWTEQQQAKRASEKEARRLEMELIREAQDAADAEEVSAV